MSEQNGKRHNEIRIPEISQEDALAEGLNGYWDAGHATPKSAYCELWDHLNAKRGYGWSANPWVWAISFRRVEREGK